MTVWNRFISKNWHPVFSKTHWKPVFLRSEKLKGWFYKLVNSNTLQVAEVEQRFKKDFVYTQNLIIHPKSKSKIRFTSCYTQWHWSSQNNCDSVFVKKLIVYLPEFTQWQMVVLSASSLWYPRWKTKFPTFVIYIFSICKAKWMQWTNHR